MKLPVRWTLEDKICEAYRRIGALSSGLHGHNHFLITLITRGEGVQTLNGEEIAFRKGDLFILSPADFHKNTLIDGESYDYFGVKFKYELLDPALFDMCVMERFPAHISLSDSAYSRISAAFEVLCDEYSSGRRGTASEVLMRGLIEQIFILALRELPPKEAGSSGFFVNRVIGFVQSNFRERLTVSDAAAFVGYTPNYFNSIFHRAFGETFGTYLRNMRLDYAKNLLLSGDLPLTVIAIESGFGSLSHFSRIFKSEIGESPTEYRKRRAGAFEN